MSNHPAISIIIPAYNIARYLPMCLDSCLAQDFKNYEIILVDDGSTDSTPKVCDDYAKNSSQITVIHQKNAGLSAARNIGIERARGAYLAFIDGDDCIGRTFLSRLYRVAEDCSADIVICDFAEFVDALPHPSTPSPTDLTDGQAATIRLLVEQENRDIMVCNKLYKKSLFKDIKYPVGLLHEDNLTTYKVLATANRVASISEALYYYRIKRPGSIMAEQTLLSRLKLKERAAKEAIAYFKDDSNLKQAAEISLLLSRFAYLDNLAAGRLADKALWQKTIQQIKKQEQSYRHNPYLTKKLRLYLNLLKMPALYRAFRKIIN